MHNKSKMAAPLMISAPLFSVFLLMLRYHVVVDGETTAQRQALYDFYVATSKGSDGWESKCSAGGWLTMGSSPPDTFCNYPGGRNSTFYGVRCSEPYGDIVHLILPQCHLNGTLTASLSELTDLQQLSLTSNSLSGTLPPQWSSFTQLQFLYLHVNQLSGTLPSEWSAMTGLQYLYLRTNQLSGTLPPQWSNITSLIQLYLYSNRLSGVLPHEWSAMRSLQYLIVYFNQLSGTLPPQWSAMTELQSLFLYSNRLTGPLPPQWSNMGGLKNLYSHGNRLSGTLPSEWSALNGLQQLSLNSNQLTSTLPPQWFNMTGLQYLYLHTNPLTGSLPPEWSTMRALQYLYLYSCQLVGTLPPQWFNMGSVLQLYLYDNQLSGTLPPQWSEMPSLEFLYLNDNQLSGTLPTQWFAMRRLQQLELQSNRLSGTLSSQWSQMSALRLLYLQMNQLGGTLPPQWSNMSDMQFLSLQVNNFVGSVPKEWPEGMRQISTVNWCSVDCSGVVGVNASCDGTGFTCLSLSLYYNCIDLASIPEINITNLWNWKSGQMNLGPQRRDCPKIDDFRTSSASVLERATDSASLTTSATMNSTESSTAMMSGLWTSAPITVSSSHSCEVTSSEETVSGTASMELPPPRKIAFSVKWEGAVSTVGAVVVSFGVTGAAAGGGVQRAALQNLLARCTSDTDGNKEPLDIASSPLQIGLGPEAGHYVRGSVIGNAFLLAACAALAFLLCAVLSWHHCRTPQKKRRPTFSSCLASAAVRLQLPGLLQVPVMFLLQPIVSSSIWCVQSSGGDLAIGLLGLLLSIVYALWAVWVVSLGRTGNFVVAVVHPVTDHGPTLLTIPPVLRRFALGVQDHTTEWVERQPNGFVQRYRTILCAYRAKRQWFLVAELLLALLGGVIGGIALTVPEACENQGLTAAYLCLLLIVLLVALVAQPYNEPIDHVLLVLSLSLGIVWALCVLTDVGDAASDALTAAQEWLGVVALLSVAVGSVASSRLRKWLKKKIGSLSARVKEGDDPQADLTQLADLVRQICDTQRRFSLRSTNRITDSQKKRARSASPQRSLPATASAINSVSSPPPPPARTSMAVVASCRSSMPHRPVSTATMVSSENLLKLRLIIYDICSCSEEVAAQRIKRMEKL